MGMGLGGGGFGAGAMGGGFAGGPGAPGIPFAGVPEELRPAVARLVADEPEHPRRHIPFSHRTAGEAALTLVHLVRRQWRIALLSLILISVETVALQTGPFLTQIGIDDGLQARHHHASVVVACGIAYLVSVAITVVVERSRVRATGRLAAYVMNDLRVKVFTHIQRLSLDFFTEEKAGVIMTRMTSDIEVLQQLLQDGLAQFAIQGLTMVVVTIVLFTYDVKLAALTVLVVVPALTVLSLWFRTASSRAYLRVRDSLAGVIGDVAESLSGVRVVAAYNRQRGNIVRHRNIVGRYRSANFVTAQVAAVYGAASDLLGLVGQLVILLVGGEMVLHHHLEVGELVAFILYLGSFFQPIQQLVQLYNTYQQGQAAIVKLRTLLATEPSVAERADAIELPAIEGDIVFDNVSFGYDPANLVLSDVNLHVAAGESVAFVGPTGAGKSTIAKLVTRFYDPTSGRILIDGFPLTDVGLASLRRQLGVVPQEPYLFSGSIRENIAFGTPEPADGDVEDAARAVGLGELIDTLPDGLDTPVHERGQSLSSGERQLIALARAFLARPRVLVLDEATSNLDLKSEALVEVALDRLLEGRTALLVAHRLSTAMRADRIVVVDAGRIVEVGSHAELVRNGGIYEAMFATWSRDHHDPEPVSPHR